MVFRKKQDHSPSLSPPKQYYRDELFPDAVEVTLECRVVSAGRLQSNLRIGSIRATKLITELEEHGIIGPERGNRPREIFFTLERWQNERHNFAWKPEEPKQEPKPTPAVQKNHCPYCGSKLPKGASSCWNCKNRLPVSTASKVCTFIVLILLCLIILLYFPSFADQASSPAPTISKVEYMNQCRTISYEKLSRNPEAYKGAYFTFLGEVIQVIEYGNSVQLRLNVTEVESYGTYYSKDPIYVTLRLHEDGNRILEKDIIRIYGQCEGLYTYVAVLGNTISIPKIDAEYWELIK